MLSRPDAALVERDPTIPGLNALLDAELFARILQQSHPLAGVRRATRYYTRYKPGISCVAAFRLETGGDPLVVSARSYAASDRIERDRNRERPAAAGPFGTSLVLLDDPGISISVFPYDRRLRALSRIEEAPRWRSLLERTLPDRPELWDSGVEILRYKPERRCVVALVHEGTPRAALKFYTHPEYERARKNASIFAARDGLRLPSLLGHSDQHRVLAFEWLPGRLLSETLLSPTLEPEPLHAVGRRWTRPGTPPHAAKSRPAASDLR